MKYSEALLSLSIVFSVSLFSHAQPPQLINYQGRLSNGTNLFNGTIGLSIRLFNTPIGGSLCCEDSNAVQVADGLYSTFIGDNIVFGSLADALTNQEVFIELAINNSALTPRERIGASAYSLFSDSAKSAQNVLRWQTVTSTNVQAQSNVGYLLASDEPVQVLLPLSPSTGDVIRVFGGGASGWTLAQNQGQSIFTKQLSSTRTAEAWRPIANTTNWWLICCSSNGQKLCATTYEGQLFTSTDYGTNWILRTPTGEWRSVASSADGNKLIAAPLGGFLYTSSDSGASWIARDTNRSWTGAASSVDGSKLAAVVGDGGIYISTDSGSTWTAHETNRNWGAIVLSSDGSKLVATSDGIAFRSTDSGATWAPSVSDGYLGRLASSSDASKLFATEFFMYAGKPKSQIYTSYDGGLTWVKRELLDGTCYKIACSSDGSQLVTAGNGGFIYISTDSGLSWITRYYYQSWQSACCSSDGTKLFVAPYGGRIHTSSSSSFTTLGQAGYLSGSKGSALELLFIGNGQFAPLSHEGLITSH